MPESASPVSARPRLLGADAATALVRDFLQTLARREVEAAARFFAPGATMIFPGGVPMTALAQIAAHTGARYRRVAKRFDRFEYLTRGETEIVYSLGTLFGEWPDGTPFEGIRYIDRFEIRDGKFTLQEVWNDAAEIRIARGQGPGR